jgi:hypothetical protein
VVGAACDEGCHVLTMSIQSPGAGFRCRDVETERAGDGTVERDRLADLATDIL